MARPPADSIAVATPKRIIEAGVKEFGRHGYHAAKLAEIGARAGIRRPSLLYHFPTKDSLYAAVVRSTFTRLGAALSKAMSKPGEFPKRVEAVVTAFRNYVDAHPELASIVIREFLDARGPGHVLLAKEIVPVLGLVETFISKQGKGHLRAGVPIRAAILQIASDILLKAASGKMRGPVWGPRDHSRELARILFIGD